MLASWSTALHGALAAKGSLFRYKNLQTPHFAPKKKKNEFWAVFWADSLSPSSLSNFSPKHIKTP